MVLKLSTNYPHTYQQITRTNVRKVLFTGQTLCYHIIKEFRTSVFAVGRVHIWIIGKRL